MITEQVTAAFSLGISIVALVTTYIIYIYNRKLGVKPVLVFLRRESDKWELANVGSGTALKVRIGEKQWKTKEWSRFTNCYPIRAGYQSVFPWLDAIALAATYEDVDGRKYTTSCQYDRNTICEGNRFAAEWPASDDDDNRIFSEFNMRQGR